MNEHVSTYSFSMGKRSLQMLAMTAALLLALLSLQLAGCAAAPDKQAKKMLASEGAIEERWGIQIMGIRQTAAGHMLDFRYRVMDAEKAEALFVRRTKPYLIDQASGKVLGVPTTAKVGPLRTSDKPQDGRIYWMFFANPGVVRVGSNVTVVIGDFRAEDLTVE